MQVFWRFLKSFCHVFICQWRTKFMTLSAESLGVHLLGYYLIGKQWLICNFMLVADTNWQLGIRWEPFRHQYWALWSIYRAICYFCQLDFDVYVCVRIWFVFQKSETRYITVIRCDSILKKKECTIYCHQLKQKAEIQSIVADSCNLSFRNVIPKITLGSTIYVALR